MPKTITRYTAEEWNARGEALFGPDRLRWRFVCPCCGHVAAVADWKAVGASDGEVAFSCIGRHVAGAKQAFVKDGPGPCTYAGGGLFGLNPCEVLTSDGQTHRVFDFDQDGAS